MMNIFSKIRKLNSNNTTLANTLLRQTLKNAGVRAYVNISNNVIQTFNILEYSNCIIRLGKCTDMSLCINYLPLHMICDLAHELSSYNYQCRIIITRQYEPTENQLRFIQEIAQYGHTFVFNTLFSDIYTIKFWMSNIQLWITKNDHGVTDVLIMGMCNYITIYELSNVKLYINDVDNLDISDEVATESDIHGNCMDIYLNELTIKSFDDVKKLDAQLMNLARISGNIMLRYNAIYDIDGLTDKCKDVINSYGKKCNL